MPDDTLRLAVLIDADNASAAVIGDILSEVASLGTASVKRVYGDFTASSLNSWRAVLAEHAVQPIQQFRNTVGKNASDSALIIDAMDLSASACCTITSMALPFSACMQIIAPFFEVVRRALKILASSSMNTPG